MGTEIGMESPTVPFGGPGGGATVGADEVSAPPMLLPSEGRGAEGRLPLGEIDDIPGVGPLPVPSYGLCVSDEDDADDESDCAKSPPTMVR